MLPKDVELTDEQLRLFDKQLKRQQYEPALHQPKRVLVIDTNGVAIVNPEYPENFSADSSKQSAS